MQLAGIFSFLLNTILWATYYAVSKEALQRVDPIIFSFLEIAVLTPIALFIIFITRKSLSREVIKRGIILGSILCLNVFTTTTALKYTTATNTAFFPSMNGFLAALIAWAFLRQSVARNTWLAGLLSVAGASMLVFESPTNGQWVGDVIAFAGAIFYTCYIFRIDYDTQKGEVPPWPLLGIELLTLVILSAIVALLFGSWHAVNFSLPRDIGIILYIGVATTFLPAAISISMQKYVSPVTVAFIYILEPVWGAVAATIYLGEALSFQGYIGGGLIIAGAIINNWRVTRQKVPSRYGSVTRGRTLDRFYRFGKKKRRQKF